MFPLKTSSIEMSPNADTTNGKSDADGIRTHANEDNGLNVAP
jgi:hypothetical protein